LAIPELFPYYRWFIFISRSKLAHFHYLKVTIPRRNRVDYIRFIFENRRFLAFGFLIALFSSFGQTFFISLFSADIRQAFDLTHGQFGYLYAIATLSSGLFLMWLGGKIDHVDLRLYSALVCGGMVAACFFMAWTPGYFYLIVAIFFLRLAGQGLMSHVSATSMVRYFQEGRGKAISIGSLGHSMGEGVFPLLAVAMLAAMGWREAWVVIALFLAVGLIPLTQWLLKGHTHRHQRLVETISVARTMGRGGRNWTQREVLRDPKFYVILTSVLAPSFMTTGLFFHQVHLADSKGWSLAWLASCFIGYAVTKVVVSLLSGPLVDRFGAMRLFPLFLPPLGVGLLILAGFNHPMSALAYLMFGGINGGLNFTIVSAMWAEMYGVLHIGSIRATVAALRVFSSALGPAFVGFLVDTGSTMETVALVFVAYIVVASALILLTMRSRQES
jgi:MFS family permease